MRRHWGVRQVDVAEHPGVGQVLQCESADPRSSGLGRRLAGEIGDQDCLAEARAEQRVETHVGGLGEIRSSGELPHGRADLEHDSLVDAGGAGVC